jgi:hypothetical protein
MERGGYGRMSLRAAVTRLQVDSATAEERLAARGIRAEWDATVRHLASQNNMSPHEIIEIIRRGD